jgi:hypothetical protein
MEPIQKTMEILESDIKEVEKLILKSRRDGVRKLLEDYKLNMVIALQTEQKNFEKNKAKVESTTKDPNIYVTVSKYAYLDSDKTGK